MKVGPYEITSFISDYVWLDGGAMFGAVPKTLWSKKIKPDEKNRIKLACRLLLLKSDSKTILVDTGCGRKWNEKLKGIYAIEYVSKPVQEQVSGVTDLVFTHLHFDHGGGVSYLDKAGKLQLSFPDAVLYIQESHLAHARNPGQRESASYLAENIEPLVDAKLAPTFDGQEILPEIKVNVANGHTKGLQWLLIGNGRGALAYPSDLIPTSHHLPVPYVMGYDLHAELAMKEKEEFLKQAVENEWVVVFQHDAEVPAAMVTVDEKGRYVMKERISI